MRCGSDRTFCIIDHMRNHGRFTRKTFSASDARKNCSEITKVYSYNHDIWRELYLGGC